MIEDCSHRKYSRPSALCLSGAQQRPSFGLVPPHLVHPGRLSLTQNRGQKLLRLEGGFVDREEALSQWLSVVAVRQRAYRPSLLQLSRNHH